MRVTRIDTIRTEEFSNLVHVLVHSDEGLTGLGETFFFADAVDAHIHDVVADYLLGEDPVPIERHAAALRGYVGAAASGAEMRAASAVDIALWTSAGKWSISRCPTCSEVARANGSARTTHARVNATFAAVRRRRSRTGGSATSAQMDSTRISTRFSTKPTSSRAACSTRARRD